MKAPHTLFTPSGLAAAAFVVASAVPAPAAADAAPTAVVPGIRAAAAEVAPTAPHALPVDPSRVREVQARALKMVDDSGDYARAAAFLEEESARPEFEHAEAAELLLLAGRLYHHGHRAREAYASLRQSAQLAFSGGEPLRAAHTLVDAAQVAQEAGWKRTAREAADLAGYVLRESHLTEAERSSVLRRVRFAGAVTGSARR